MKLLTSQSPGNVCGVGSTIDSVGAGTVGDLCVYFPPSVTPKLKEDASLSPLNVMDGKEDVLLLSVVVSMVVSVGLYPRGAACVCMWREAMSRLQLVKS